MGVRGLTTFIAKNADKYFENYELRDTLLVIDGNNLAFQLYNWHARCYDCFGGDYDKYVSVVTNFFKLLKNCNVNALVVFDGSYENRKFKTIVSRLKNRIEQAGKCCAGTEGSVKVYPLFMREVFVDTVLKLGVSVVRCTFEADYDMACIARYYGCPVLSYDSDFYIYDVLYVPFSTVSLNVNSKSNSLPCKLYRMDNFLKSFGGLRKENVPLLATLLGNDYVEISTFKSFYKHIKLERKNYGESPQQRRIAAVIKWLRDESFESALKKILGRVRMQQRKCIANQIKAMTQSYLCTESVLKRYWDVTGHSLAKRIGRDVDAGTSCDDGNVPHKSNVVDDIMNDVSDAAENIDDGSASTGSECDDMTTRVSDNEISDDTSDTQDDDSLPAFFKENYVKCLYPACITDLIFHNKYFFIPQVEDYSCPSAHHVSFSLLSAIYAILCPENEGKLKVINRNDNGKLYYFNLDKCSERLPRITELQALGYEDSLGVFLQVVDVNRKEFDIINTFPPSWRLYTLSVLYWMKHARPNCNKSHLCAVLLGALVLNSNNRANVPQNASEIEVLMSNVTKNNFNKLRRDMVPNFFMNVKLQRNHKVYDKSIVHAFAQFQSCALHVQFVNKLLNRPLENYLISDFYNGTLVYNLCTSFSGRSDLNGYVNLLLKQHVSVLNVMTSLVKTYESLLLFVNADVTRRRRRRNRRKEKVEEMDVDDANENNVDDEPHIFDVNNKFSILGVMNQ